MTFQIFGAGCGQGIWLAAFESVVTCTMGARGGTAIMQGSAWGAANLWQSCGRYNASKLQVPLCEMLKMLQV